MESKECIAFEGLRVESAVHVRFTIITDNGKFYFTLTCCRLHVASFPGAQKSWDWERG